MKDQISFSVEEHANTRLALAEKIVLDTIHYLRKNRCYAKADELQLAYISLNRIEIEKNLS